MEGRRHDLGKPGAGSGLRIFSGVPPAAVNRAIEPFRLLKTDSSKKDNCLLRAKTGEQAKLPEGLSASQYLTVLSAKLNIEADLLGLVGRGLVRDSRIFLPYSLTIFLVAV